MQLAEFALLVDADPKWVLNTRAILGRGVRYTVEAAERVALVRILNRELGIPLPAAWELAGNALTRTEPKGVFEQASSGEIVTLTIDVRRLRAAVATRRSQLATMHGSKRAGRKPKRALNALEAARRYGLDVTLLQANLARSPKVRLRQLDGMAALPTLVRRKR